MIQEDLGITFDLGGFASSHVIDGVPVVCVVGDKISGRSEVDDAWIEMFEVLIKAADITEPHVRQKMVFDGVTYSVDAVKVDSSVFTVNLALPKPGDKVRSMGARF